MRMLLPRMCELGQNFRLLKGLFYRELFKCRNCGYFIIYGDDRCYNCGQRQLWGLFGQ